MGTQSTIQEQISYLLHSETNNQGTSACLFNLIVYTHEPRRTDYFKEVVRKIKSMFPCRIIFIQGNPSAQDHLATRTFTEKNPENGVICDQIWIEASGQDIHRVYFLLFPLLVPDLPIYLLWGQDPTTEYTILPHLQSFATRLIFDSEATENLQQFSRDMLNRLRSTSIQIVDMNWTRIGGWREVLAQTFDSPGRFEQLTASTTFNIVYNNRPSDLFLHPETQAIYLQAWLASRLGWRLQRAEKKDQVQCLYYQYRDTVREIRLLPFTDERFEPEEILGVKVGGGDYACRLRRIAIDQVQVQASNQSQCTVPFILLMPTLKTGRSFMQEIFYQKMSEQYVAILKLISAVNWSEEDVKL